MVRRVQQSFDETIMTHSLPQSWKACVRDDEYRARRTAEVLLVRTLLLILYLDSRALAELGATAAESLPSINCNA